jgi:Zn-dependent peptidase ImmA (M78 family)
LPDWLAGGERPTLRQLEAFAAATNTPVGYLFLDAPPVEALPIPDMRTVGSRAPATPSADLLDTVYLCQQRQAWYRDYALSIGEEPLAFIGSACLTSDTKVTADAMGRALGFHVGDRNAVATWQEALRRFAERAEDLGVLVMTSGIVGTNTRRVLDPEEFRGFALSDSLAPLVFVNGADTKSAQMFTLAHELAHLWLGESALGDSHAASQPHVASEAWCNRVAAELLVPIDELRAELHPDAPVGPEIDRLSRVFKVSTLVIIRRLFDVGHIEEHTMRQIYGAELSRLRARSPRRGGGDFYLSQRARVGRRFARAVYESTWGGRSSFTEAFRLLNVSSMDTFQRLGFAVGAIQ